MDEYVEHEKPRGRLRRRVMYGFVGVVLGIFVIGTLLSPHPGEMPGAGEVSKLLPIADSDVDVLLDVSGWKNGERRVEQEIMTRLFDMIDRADDCIILDMFLVNGFGELPRDSSEARDLSAELIDALVRKKRASPNTFILFISDPINSIYVGECPDTFKPLADAGGSVVFTDLTQLPDSNLVYSPFYRVLRPVLTRIPWVHRRFIGNPLSNEKSETDSVSVAQFARLLNFKANHRKVALIQNRTGAWEALIASANPHTASSLHGNAGLHLTDGPIIEMVRSEYYIARASALSSPRFCFGGMSALELTRELENRLKILPDASRREKRRTGVAGVQYVTEHRIGNKVDWMLAGAGRGDNISIAMFYLSDPAVVSGLVAAAERGASLRIMLDPNAGAFGFKKSGVPNRVVVESMEPELKSSDLDVRVRWFDTHGEQGHYKLMRVNNPVTGKEQLLLGSANFTRRNLRGYNLEAAVYLEGAVEAGQKIEQFFDKAWNNTGEISYTLDRDSYSMEGMSYIIARAKLFLGTRLGLGTY